VFPSLFAVDIPLTLSLFTTTIFLSSCFSFSLLISQVVLGKNAMIAGLQFIVTNSVSGTSTSTYCGTKNGLSAFIGRAGKSVGALGGTCSMGTTAGRRRLSQGNNSTSTPGLVGSTFTSIVTPAPQGSNNSPPFSPSTTFTIDGKTVSGGNVTNGTAAGRRLRMRRAMLAASWRIKGSGFRVTRPSTIQRSGAAGRQR